MEWLTKIVSAVGPDVLSVAVPIIGTELVKRVRKAIPKEVLPWIAMAFGGATAIVPTMPSVGSGLKGGLAAAGLYYGTKMLYRARAKASAK